jgi:Dynamin family
MNLIQNGSVPVEGTKYNILDELADSDPFYRREFQQAISEAITILERSEKALSSAASLSHVPEIHKLKNRAEELRRFTSNETRIIGLLGASGEGKSSLINSLLNYSEISPTNAGGAACTSVVTEFRQSKPDQTAEILIEIERLSDDQITEMLKQAVADYRMFWVVHNPSTDGDQEAESDEHPEMQKDADSALSLLEAAFGDRAEFSEDFLREPSPFAEDSIVDQLRQWVQESIWPAQAGLIKTKTAHSAAECSEITSEVMEGNLWPFISIIRVHLDSPLLKAGVILADLPGLQDTNVARVKATESYLFRCDHFFIVANISRCMTDQSLKTSLLHVLTKHMPIDPKRPPRFSIVCSKSDQISAKGLKREIGRLGTDTEKMELKLLDEICPSEDVTGEVDPRMSNFLSKYRSEKVKRGLKLAYTKQFKGHKVEVFPVSNVSYHSSVAKNDMNSIRASGVPELRRFSFSLASSTQYVQYEHFLKTLVPDVLNSMQVWVEGNDTMVKADRDFKDLLNQEITSVERRLNKRNQETMDAILKSYEIVKAYACRNKNWIDAAAEEALKYHSWHSRSYNAWCQKSGEYKTKTRGYVNWNQDIIWKLRTEVGPSLDDFKGEVLDIFDKGINDAIKQAFNDINLWAKGVGFRQSIAVSISFEKEKLLNFICQKQREFLEKELFEIEIKVTEGNASSYIRAQMAPGYKKARLINGKGQFKAQKEAIESHIKNPKVFIGIMTKHEQDLSQKMDKVFSVVVRAAKTHIQQVRRTLLYAVEGDHKQNRDDSAQQGLIYKARDKLAKTLNTLHKAYDTKVLPALS